MRGVRNSLTVGAAAILSGLALLTYGGIAAAPVSADATFVTFTEDGTFTVPAGITCIGIQVDGARGGSGSDGEGGSGGAGGSGAEVQMLVIVEPGTDIGVQVGAAGSDGTSGGGGGGGGASAVFLPSGEPFAVAGGGGGGGSAYGGDAGGAGGDGGEFGAAGSAGAIGSATGGAGGSESGPGAAGTNDGAGSAPTAGADTPPAGGVGGGGAYGGGGGGDGYFGGGGGGSGATASGAGGGGGGSAVNPVVAPSIVVVDIEAGVNADAGSVSFAYEAGTDCNFAPLTVKKVVAGPVAPGTTFTEHVACTEDTIIVPLGASESGLTRDFVFTVDSDGVAQPSDGYSIGFTDPNACTVSETVDGGAVSVSYACTASVDSERDSAVGPTDWVGAAVGPPTPEEICPVAGPTDAPVTVNVVDSDQRVTVTVTNTFAAFTG